MNESCYRLWSWNDVYYLSLKYIYFSYTFYLLLKGGLHIEIEYLLRNRGHISEGESSPPCRKQGQAVYDIWARTLDLVSGSCNVKRIILCFHFFFLISSLQHSTAESFPWKQTWGGSDHMGACNISIKCSHIGRDIQLDVSEHKIGSRENWHWDQPHFFRLSRWFRDEIYPVVVVVFFGFFFFGSTVHLEKITKNSIV